MIRPLSRCVLVGAVVVLAGAGCGDAAVPTSTQLRENVFEPRCGATGCHGGSNPARGLDLVTDPRAALVDVKSVVDPAQKYVVAGNIDDSLLLKVLRGPVASSDGANDCRQMPPGYPLQDDDIAAVEAWIADGAKSD